MSPRAQLVTKAMLPLRLIWTIVYIKSRPDVHWHHSLRSVTCTVGRLQ